MNLRPVPTLQRLSSLDARLGSQSSSMDEHIQQSILDEEHLRLLRIGYFIHGGITVFFSLFGLMYIFMGIVVSSFPAPGAGPPPRFIGLVFALFGAVFVAAGAIFAVLQFLAAQGLGRRRSRTLCLVAAAITCIFIPYGTVLGVCTFVVLSRPGVRALFSDGAAS
jgi:hypothetical protein